MHEVDGKQRMGSGGLANLQWLGVGGSNQEAAGQCPAFVGQYWVGIGELSAETGSGIEPGSIAVSRLIKNATQSVSEQQAGPIAWIARMF